MGSQVGTGIVVLLVLWSCVVLLALVARRTAQAKSVLRPQKSN